MKYLPSLDQIECSLDENDTYDVYLTIKKIISKIETKNNNYLKKMELIETQIENISEYIDSYKNKNDKNIEDYTNGIKLLERIYDCINKKLIKEYIFSTSISSEDVLEAFIDNNKYNLVRDELRIWYFNKSTLVASWNDIETLGLKVKLSMYNNKFILHF